MSSVDIERHDMSGEQYAAREFSTSAEHGADGRAALLRAAADWIEETQGVLHAVVSRYSEADDELQLVVIISDVQS